MQLWILFDKGIRYSAVIDAGCADGHSFLNLFEKGAFASAVPVNIDANVLYEGSLRAIQEIVGVYYRVAAITDHVGEIQTRHSYWTSLRAESDPYWERLSATKSMVPRQRQIPYEWSLSCSRGEDWRRRG